MNNAVHYEDALMVKAAWYYYFENMTQQAIADRLSISRMRVIKLLETARQNGVIQFRLRSDSVGMMQQSRELMQKYHLNDVFIIPEAEQEGQLNESIARAGAMYVADRLSENACINVGYGDTLSRTLNHLATMVQNPVTCISLTGGVSYYLPNGRSNVFNARLYLMPAPLLASSHEMAAAMRAEASVSEIIRMAALSSFTLVGIGSMHETATIVRSGIITQNELFRLRIDGGEQRERADRLDHGDLADDVFHLVALEVADKVDPGPLIGPGLQVGGQLLNPVFPAHLDPGGNSRPDGVVRLYLGGGAQGDLTRRPAGVSRRLGDFCPHRLNILCQLHKI